MKHKKYALSLALPLLALPLFAFGVLEVRTQDDADMDMQTRPTEHHALLKRLAGEWKTTMDMPGYGVSGIEGTATSRMLGELWLIDEYQTTLMGAPFRGHGQTGYDSRKGKYVGSWIDTMSDSMTLFEGTYDAEARTLRFDVPGRDPMTGEEYMGVHETRLVSDDEMTFHMLMPGPEGELMEVLRIRYEREG